MRGTGDKPFKRSFGDKSASWYLLSGKKESKSIYLVEGPVDALALKAHKHNDYIIAIGGNMLSMEDVKAKLPDGYNVLAAFNNDIKGRQFSDDAARLFGAQRYAPPEKFKDWAEAVQAAPAELVAERWRDMEQEKAAEIALKQAAEALAAAKTAQIAVSRSIEKKRGKTPEIEHGGGGMSM